MSNIRVITDSACDLTDETLQQLRIGLVPLHIRFGDEELVDREELSTAQFWSRIAASDTLPETSAPSPGAFAEAFTKMADEGADGVVCVNLSSKMSATIQSARQGARSLEGKLDVRVVDSLSVTLGLGMAVVAAAEAAGEGQPIEQVVAAAEAVSADCRVYGAIDTLENLRRGGRIGGAAALVGSLLSIKPVIEVRDGVVEQESKQRTRQRALKYLADKVHEAGPFERIAIFDADAPDVEQFVGMLGDIPTEKPLLKGTIGPVIGTHCGPGALGVSWIPKRG